MQKTEVHASHKNLKAVKILFGAQIKLSYTHLDKAIHSRCCNENPFVPFLWKLQISAVNEVRYVVK